MGKKNNRRKIIKTTEQPWIMIALTAYRTIEQRTVQSLFNVVGGLPYRFNVATHTSANVWKGRNDLVRIFLDTSAEYLLFLDADMVFNSRDVDNLVKGLIENREAGLIGGFYVSRDESLRPLIGWTDNDGIQLPAEECIKQLLESRGKVVEADLVPTGFMLIRREVFEKLDEPWFHVNTRVTDDGNIHHFSSDNVFVQKVKAAGYKTLGHFGVELGHIGNFVYHPAHMWPQLEAWAAMDDLNQAKARFGDEYGYNSKEYWDSLYSTEHALGRTRDYPSLHLAIVAGIQKDWSVLDVGSGPGVLASKIKAVAKAVDCLDLSDTAVKICRDKGLTADQWDIVNDPVPTGLHGAYDCVACTEVLEHLDDPEAAIKKLYSFLKPGGLVVVSVPDDCLPPEEEPEHVATYTAAKFGNLMRPFENVYIQSIAERLLAVGTKPEKKK